MLSLMGSVIVQPAFAFHEFTSEFGTEYPVLGLLVTPATISLILWMLCGDQVSTRGWGQSSIDYMVSNTRLNR